MYSFEMRAASSFGTARLFLFLSNTFTLTSTAAECVFQVFRNTMLFEEIRKGLVCQFLKGAHPVAAQLNKVPICIVIEFDQLTHGASSEVSPSSSLDQPQG